MTDSDDEPGDMNLRLETVKGLLGKVVQAVLGFAGTIIFARALGPTSFGGFYWLLSLVLLANRPLQGLASAVRKRYSESGASKGEIVGTVLFVTVLFSAVAGAVAWLLRNRLASASGIEPALLVFVALFTSLGFFAPFQQMLAAEGWVGKQTWNDTLRSVLTLGLQLAFVTAGLGAAGMGYGLAGASILAVPVAAYLLRVRPALPSRETVMSMWAYGKYSTPGSFVGKAYDRFDILLIGFAVSQAATGYYEVALKLTVPAIFLPQVIGSGLLPKISNKESSGQAVADDISNAAAYASLFSVPLFFGAAALSQRLVVTAYGSDYRAAAPLLVGLALYQLLRSQTQMYRQTLGGLDRPDLTLRIDTVTLVLNVIVGVALVYIVGPVGVVAATVLAESARYLLSVHSVGRLIGDIEPLPRPLLDQFAASAGMFVVLFGLVQVIRLPSFAHVAAVVATGGVAYGVLLLAISPGVRQTSIDVLTEFLNTDRLGISTLLRRRQ